MKNVTSGGTNAPVKLDSLVRGTEAGMFRLLNFNVLQGSGDDADQFEYV